MDLDKADKIDFEAGDFSHEDLKKFDRVELKYDGNYSSIVTSHHDGVPGYRIIRRGGDAAESAYGPEYAALTRLGSSSVFGEFLFGTQWALAHEYKHIYLFDATEIQTVDISKKSLLDRRAAIADFVADCKGTALAGRVHLAHQWPIEGASDLWKAYVVDGDFEGLVFKNSQASFGSTIGRMKRNVTADYVCLGFDASDSVTYKGWGVAAILGGQYVDGKLEQVCKVSGLTAEWRKEFYDHPDRYIGCVFEAKGKQLFRSGALRHPNFVRWRDDKPAESCVLRSK